MSVCLSVCVHMSVCLCDLVQASGSSLLPDISADKRISGLLNAITVHGQTIKIDSAFAFYHTPNIPGVRAQSLELPAF